jgi:hypothetical protein
VNRIHRSASIIAALAVSIIGFVAAAPAAFAMRTGDPGGSAPYVPHVTVVHSGVVTWQVALIAVLAALGAAAATAITLRAYARTGRLHPAAG